MKKAFSGGNVKREDMFVISKVWWSDVEDVEAACRLSLEKLGLDYLDMYLVHWPVAQKAVTDEAGETSWERLRMPMHKIWA